MGRYEIHPDEDYQPGSTEVLKNYLGSCNPAFIEEEETKALEATYQHYIKQLNADDPISTELILEMHKKWLGKIYPFAGKYRSVSMSKGGFPFAAPKEIERLMNQFGKKELKIYTPCRTIAVKDLAFALAVVHIEFILIHPFREGQTYYTVLSACFIKSSNVTVFPDFFRTLSTLFSAAILGKPRVSKADNASLRKVLCGLEDSNGCVSSQLSFQLRRRSRSATPKDLGCS